MTEVEQERSAAVQLLFRDVNERIHSLGAELFQLGGRDAIQVICECLQVTCRERIGLAADAYEGIRGRPEAFVVLPGHERLEIEQVVQRHEAYLVVEKEAGLLARVRGGYSAAMGAAEA
jgi:hypothetical protein